MLNKRVVVIRFVDLKDHSGCYGEWEQMQRNHLVSEVTVASTRVDNGYKRSMSTRLGDGLDERNEEKRGIMVS